MDTANPKALEERIQEDFEVTCQGVGKSTKDLFFFLLEDCGGGCSSRVPH